MMNLTVFGQTDVGRVRSSNEDAFVVADLTATSSRCTMTVPLAIEVRERGVLLAVSDGIGGDQAGDVASALGLHALRRAMRHRGADDVEAELCASVQKANRRVWKAARSSGNSGMEATLTAMLFHGLHAYVAEIGSSRAYLLRGEEFTQLTRDRSHVQLLPDLGALARAQAGSHEYASALMQALGARPMVAIMSSRVELSHGDRFLLCSAGLSDKLRDEEMHRILAAATSMDAACTTLTSMANERGGEDNITAIAAALDDQAQRSVVAGQRNERLTSVPARVQGDAHPDRA